MTLIAPALPVTVSHVVLPGTLARRAEARPGESVARFLKRLRWRFDLDTILVVDGRPVLRRDGGWRRTVIRPGADIRFISRPFGGQSGKQLAGLAALIALTVFAPQITGPLLGAMFGAASAVPVWASGLANALVVAGGMMLFNTLVYPRSGNKSDEDGLYSFNASGNVARPLETIPSAYGRLQRDLDYAAIPYRTFEGNDEYFHGLFMVGCGRYQHEALLIEDNPFWTAEAAAADGTGSGSGGTVPAAGWVNNTTGGRPNSPGILAPWQGIQVEFVEPGEPVTLFPTNIHQSPEVSGLEFDHAGSGGPNEGWSPWFSTVNPGLVTSLVHLDLAFPSGFIKNGHETLANYQVRFRPVNDAGAPVGDVQVFDRQIVAFQKRPWRKTVSFQLAPARWQISFRRSEAPVDPAQGSTDIYAAGVRAELPGSTVFAHGTMVAVRIRATKQLSDYSQRRIRYRGTRILPVWAEDGFEDQPTRNPVWAGLDLRTHAVHGGKLPLSRVLLEDLIAEAAAAESRGDTFDYEFRNAVAIGEAVDTAFGAARAKHRWLGHTFSIVRDEWRDTARMLITDREMVAGSFSLHSTFRPASAPDGLILNYLDEETWQKAQVVVPLGATPSNPVIEEGRGITRRAHATREAVFKWNAQVRRRVAPSFTMMTDGHILAYGDHVDLSSQAPQGWGEAHAVVGLSGNVVRLPRAADWPEATLYAVVRTALGRTFGPCRVTQGTTPRHVVFNADDLAAVLAGTGMTLADALSRQPDADPPTLALGRAFDFLRRAVITSAEPAGEKMMLAGFLDYVEVHAPDPVEEAPRPPPVEFPARRLPRIAGLDAGLTQELFETRLRASWLPSPHAIRYVAEISYDAGETWITVYDGVAPGFDAVVDNADLLLRVTPHGERGAGYTSDHRAIAAIAVITVPAGSVDWTALDEEIQERIEEAEADATQALDDARDLRAAISQIPDIRASVAGRLQFPLYDLLATTAQMVDFTLGQIATTADTLRQATIEVDAASGTVKIRALDQFKTETATNFSQVSANFDAVNSQIELRATKAELDAAVEAIVAGFAPAYRWEFNGTAEGWTASNVTLTPGAGSATAAATAGGAYIQSPALTLAADTNKVIGLRVRRTAGTGWGLSALWGASYEHSRAIGQPADPDQWTILRLDQTGQTGWSGTLTGLRLTIEDGTTLEIDYIELGNSALNDLIVGDLAARIADVEIGLDAANAELSLRATLIELGAAEDRITTAENRLDAAEAAILLRVTTAQRDEDLTRLTNAEINIDALQNQITTTLFDFTSSADIQMDLAEVAATGIHSLWNRTQELQAGLAFASQTISARVDDDGRAIASIQTDLLALSGSTTAQFAALTQVVADGDAALASRASALETTVNHPSTGVSAVNARLSSEEATRAAADSALATRATTLEATVFDSSTDSNAALKARIATEETTRASQDSAIAASVSSLSATINTKTRTFVQTSAPTADNTGDLWFDSDDGNKLHRWDGSSWVVVQDANKNKVTAAGSAPSSPIAGDVWIDTSANNRVKVWSGSTWVDYTDTRLTTAQADITTLQTAVADLDSAYASLETEVEANYNDLSASGLIKMTSISAPSGAASAAKMLVKASDSGNFADAGLEMVAIAGGGGSPQGYLVLVGNRIYRRPSGGGTPVLMVDSDGRFVTPALAPGTTRRRVKLTRNNSVNFENIGVGTATGNGTNGWKEFSIGSLEVVANPGVMSGVGSGEGIVEASMRLTVQPNSINGAGKVVHDTPADVRVAFAVIARRTSYSDVLVCDPPIEFSAVTANFSTSVNWTANFPLVVDYGTTVLAAGTWDFYLAWRLQLSNIVTLDASTQTIKVTGHCTVTTDRC